MSSVNFSSWIGSALALVVLVARLGAAPHTSSIPPSADDDVLLSDGRTLHVRELPLGQMDGVIRDGARFDATGTRVAFLAAFPGGSIDGDWHAGQPVQAYVADLSRHALLQLTDDGKANSVRWRDATHVAVTDGGATKDVTVAGPAATATRHERIVAIGTAPAGQLVSPRSVFRLQVFREDGGAYGVGQVGAVRLRTVAIAANGTSALVGPFAAWIDASRRGEPPFTRSGPDDVAPPAFDDAAYGKAQTSLLPLGHLVYQGAYRNGVAYFAFTDGLERIVASTTNFATYSYPTLPEDPAFTVGDGLGAGADGLLYFARPEDGTLQFWRSGHYASRSMVFPDGVHDSHRLFAAMSMITKGEGLVPPLMPDADALDAALLEWRVYPIGDSTGDRWAASFLGRAFVAGGDAKYTEIAEPSFPFAVLGRTDDGRLWGASPVERTIRSHALAATQSVLWSSRDGERWMLAATLPGDAAAVGLHDGSPWVALTAPEPDAPGIEIARVGGASTVRAAPTGAIYAGEDLFFASLDAGWYLVCGGAAGTRADDQGGPLQALRIDEARLFAFGSDGFNDALRARVASRPLPAQSPSKMPAAGYDPMLYPSLGRLLRPGTVYTPTLVTNVDTGAIPKVRVVSVDGELWFESEYAWHPYPLATVHIGVHGDSATVERTYAAGPLAGDGSLELWSRGTEGSWHLARVVSRWKLP